MKYTEEDKIYSKFLYDINKAPSEVYGLPIQETNLSKMWKRVEPSDLEGQIKIFNNILKYTLPVFDDLDSWEWDIFYRRVIRELLGIFLDITNNIRNKTGDNKIYDEKLISTIKIFDFIDSLKHENEIFGLYLCGCLGSQAKYKKEKKYDSSYAKILSILLKDNVDENILSKNIPQKILFGYEINDELTKIWMLFWEKFLKFYKGRKKINDIVMDFIKKFGDVRDSVEGQKEKQSLYLIEFIFFQLLNSGFLAIEEDLLEIIDKSLSIEYQIMLIFYPFEYDHDFRGNIFLPTGRIEKLSIKLSSLIYKNIIKSLGKNRFYNLVNEYFNHIFISIWTEKSIDITSMGNIYLNFNFNKINKNQLINNLIECCESSFRKQ